MSNKGDSPDILPRFDVIVAPDAGSFGRPQELSFSFVMGLFFFPLNK